MPVASGQLPWGPVVSCWLIVQETEFLPRVQLTLPLGVVNPLSSMALLGAGALKLGVAVGVGVGVGVGVAVGVGVLLGLADEVAVGVPPGVWGAVEAVAAVVDAASDLSPSLSLITANHQ